VRLGCHKPSSGVSLACEPFGCRWDSGQLGVIYAPPLDQRWDESAQTWLPATTPAERKAATEAYLRAKIEHLDDIASGNVWGYIVRSPEGDEIGSCWGYVGDPDDGLLGEARGAVDHEIARRETGDRLVAQSFAL
jgi:hypothetical protein